MGCTASERKEDAELERHLKIARWRKQGKKAMTDRATESGSGGSAIEDGG